MKNLDHLSNLQRPANHKEVVKGLLAEIVKFIDKHHIASREIETAYKLALGIYENDPDRLPREEVYVLAQKIDEQTKNGLPLTDVVDLIQQK